MRSTDILTSFLSVFLLILIFCQGNRYTEEKLRENESTEKKKYHHTLNLLFSRLSKSENQIRIRIFPF